MAATRRATSAMVGAAHGHRPQQGPQVTKNKSIEQTEAAAPLHQTRQVCAGRVQLAPDEWQPMELFKISKDKLALSFIKNRVGTHVPARERMRAEQCPGHQEKREEGLGLSLCA